MSSFISIGVLLLVSAISINGRVVDEKEQPVAGAVVKIATARPRVGPQMTCPSCYIDCGKVAISNPAGEFTIDDVSPKLFFSLVSGKLGFEGELTPDVDPLEPNLTLHLKQLAESAPEDTLSGRVVDLRGEPVVGALVSVGTVMLQSGSLSGSNAKITPACVTDEDGNFALRIASPVRSITLKVRVPGYAATDVTGLAVGRPGQEIQVGPGATLMGRIIHQGQVVSGMKLGLVQEDRRIGNVFTPEELVTNENGEFRWDNLPPNIDYAIYSAIGENHSLALPVSITTAPGHGELADLGDVEAQSAHRLQIRFLTNDKRPIPDRSYCYVSRLRASHSARQPIPSETATLVTFTGVASELLTLGIRVPGYEVIATDPMFQVDLNRALLVHTDSDQLITVTLGKSE